jgi:hypothetical protein
MENGPDKVKEDFYRRWAKRLGLFHKKSRAKRLHIDNQRGYMLIDPYINSICCGEEFDLNLEQVEALLADHEKELSRRKG